MWKRSRVNECGLLAATEALFAQYPDIEAVMCFAGLKAVGESVRKPLEYYTNNLVSCLAQVAMGTLEKLCVWRGVSYEDGTEV